MPLDDARERLLMQYLDGSLAGAELTAFKRQLQRDEQLQAQLRAARHIDTSLRRTFHARSGITAADILALTGEATTDASSAALESTETPAVLRNAGPAVGHDTFDVMTRILGYRDDETAELAAAGVVS